MCIQSQSIQLSSKPKPLGFKMNRSNQILFDIAKIILNFSPIKDY